MPSAVNEDTVSGVPAANNPRPLRGMGDHAEYWVNNSGEAFVFKFPTTVDLDAQFDRTSPYYNLPRTGVSNKLISQKYMTDQYCNTAYIVRPWCLEEDASPV
jgi:hypothetical protein